MQKSSTKRKGEIRHERSSGNVFVDVGLPEDYLAKATLVAEIDQIISERGLTQVQAAKTMGIDQPRVSALLRGKLDLFSLDRLMTLISHLGNRVEVTVNPAPDNPGVQVVCPRRSIAASAGGAEWISEASTEPANGFTFGNTSSPHAVRSGSVLAGEILINEHQFFPYWGVTDSTEDRELYSL